MHNKVF